MVITEDLDSSSHQSPVVRPVNFLSNCSVALSGTSVRVNPVDEKSVQVGVIRFAARDCKTIGKH